MSRNPILVRFVVECRAMATRRKRQTAELTHSQLSRELKRVLNIPDVELMTLKAHLLLEIALTHLLMARLRVRRSALPRLTFAQIADVALAGINDQFSEPTKRLVASVNKLRNAYAHHVKPGDQVDRMREIAKARQDLIHLSFQWPRDEEAQRPLFRDGLAIIIGTVYGMRAVILRGRKSDAALLRRARRDL